MQLAVDEGEKKGRKPTADQIRILDSAPDCDVGVLIFVRAFAELSTERATLGMAPGPIPVSRMWEWCDRQCNRRGLLPHVADHAIAVFRRVDDVILQRARSKK